MYRSHPVRRMCDDPFEGQETVLVVEPADDERTIEHLEAAIGVAGGTVDARLSYGALRVRIPEERVADLCSLAGIAAVETADVIGIGGDAGEDLKPERDRSDGSAEEL